MFKAVWSSRLKHFSRMKLSENEVNKRDSMESFIEINTDNIEPPKVGNDLYSNRLAMAEIPFGNAKVSVIVTAYNRLDKTQRCVKSLLENTTGIDYELILIDNGSTDGTLEFFRSVKHDKKSIIHITRNLGAGYPLLSLDLHKLGRFFIPVQNDLIFTPRWLENLLRCINSDPKIGMVNPVSSNTSNLQGINIPYSNYKEMQRKAEAFNKSDPGKWEDRLRLITLGTLYRKEVFLAGKWPLSDMGFFHDFSDDDMAFAIRRLGYRTVLAGDTWICHDHDLFNGEGKDTAEFQRSLNIGRNNFQEKYFGVDAWDDVNNYYIPYLSYFPKPSVTRNAAVLGVDVRCGTPILDIKNWLRRFGIFHTDLSAFTQDAKYWTDLKTICSGPVICDREEFLIDSFACQSFDYVVADRPLNRYHEPQKLINDLFDLCKSGGFVICRLKNTFSFQEYANLLGQRNVYDHDFSYNIPVEALMPALEQHGNLIHTVAVPFQMAVEQRQIISGLIPSGLPKGQREELLNRMLCQEFMLIVKKY